MKIHTLTRSALALIMIAPVLETAVVNADAQPGVTQATPQINDSKGKIQLVESTEVPDTVDPTDPSKPIDPDKNGGDEKETGNKGPLSLDVVPSFNFGIRAVDSVERTYHALTQNAKLGPKDDSKETAIGHFVQITDKRGNDKRAYNLNVKDTGFKGLSGSVLFLRMPDIRNSNGGMQDAGMSSATLKGDELTSDGVDIVMEGGSQKGTNIYIFGGNYGTVTGTEQLYTVDGVKDKMATVDSAISLTVPASPKAGTYTDTITWTLSTSD